MRATWLLAGSSWASTPSGTSSGRRVIATIRSSVCDRRQLAEEGRHVRLVSGAAAAEDVCVDGDERLHPASSL